MKARLFFYIPALVYTGVILYLSLINLAETPVKELGVSDKVMHLAAYFGLAFIWIFAVMHPDRNENILKEIFIISVLSIGFGIFIEVLQDILTLYRELDFYDIIANSMGVILAAGAVWLLKESLIRLKAKIYLVFIKK